uniref:SAC3_GANP domain-containing protein n=1 Tax=Angiostrongylus cantonensis TaxID=6313 RepID=A0A0K0D5R1_ANGCA
MISFSNPIVGKCMTMCPESEIRFRQSHNMVHPMEKSRGDGSKFLKADVHRMVKEYTRSAAGSDHRQADLLRPPDVLLKTVRYLLNLYRTEKASQYSMVFSFVCDRLRAVRQDMVLQQCPALDSTRILQEMIPFYFETDYLCRTKNCDTYDWKLHSTQLEECLSRWIETVAAIPRHFADSRLICSYILYNIPHYSALLDLYDWREFLDSGTFDALRDIILAFRANNYVRFFRRLHEVSSDSIVVAAVQAVQIIRRRALHAISIAYKSPNNKLPVTAISKWLYHEHASDLLRCFSVPCSDLILVSSINMNDNDDSYRLLAEID